MKQPPKNFFYCFRFKICPYYSTVGESYPEQHSVITDHNNVIIDKWESRLQQSCVTTHPEAPFWASRLAMSRFTIWHIAPTTRGDTDLWVCLCVCVYVHACVNVCQCVYCTCMPVLVCVCGVCTHVHTCVAVFVCTCMPVVTCVYVHDC
jgi:hypothetical protein